MLREPATNLPKLEHTYQQIREDYEKLANILFAFPKPASYSNIPQTRSPMCIQQQEARLQTSHSILLAQAIQLNCVLRDFEPPDMDLSKELWSFVDDVIGLAKRASCYRPLGASSMPLCLVAALAATEHSDREAQLEALLVEYQADFPSTKWLRMAEWLRPRWKRDHYDPKLIQPAAGTLTTIKCIRSMFKP